MKNILIITDGTEFIHSTALLIKDALPGYKVKICNAEDFSGTDLLPVELFFIGCEKSKPQSFTYLEQLLDHINLASRKCGVFSSNEKTSKYLASILKDCEVYTGRHLLVKEDVNNDIIKNWVNELLEG